MIQEPLLPCVEIEPATRASHSLIWLHGLGADGNDFTPIVPELHLPASLGVRFIFPHAPTIPVTINRGEKMRAWFDIAGLTIDSSIDTAGITASVRAITQLILHEISRGIPTHHILVAGFSQGAVIAMATGLSYPERLSGILALSGYLPHSREWLAKANVANLDTPFFLAHGKEDGIVPCALGETTYIALKEAGYPVAWHTYPMAHSVCQAEVKAISDWILSIWQ